MKLVLYVLLVLLSSCILRLLSLMVDRPFNAADMTRAYSAGCNMGSNRPLTYNSIIRCDQLSTLYGTTLNELMKSDTKDNDGDK